MSQEISPSPSEPRRKYTDAMTSEECVSELVSRAKSALGRIVTAVEEPFLRQLITELYFDGELKDPPDYAEELLSWLVADTFAASYFSSKAPTLTFQNTKLNNLKFSAGPRDNPLFDIKFENCELNDVSIIASTLGGITFDYCQIRTLSVKESKLASLKVAGRGSFFLHAGQQVANQAQSENDTGAASPVGHCREIQIDRSVFQQLMIDTDLVDNSEYEAVRFADIEIERVPGFTDKKFFRVELRLARPGDCYFSQIKCGAQFASLDISSPQQLFIEDCSFNQLSIAGSGAEPRADNKNLRTDVYFRRVQATRFSLDRRLIAKQSKLEFQDFSFTEINLPAKKTNIKVLIAYYLSIFDRSNNSPPPLLAYEALSSALESDGFKSQALEVRVHAERMRRRAENNSFVALAYSCLLRVTSGYGYWGHRLIIGSLAIIISGAILAYEVPPRSPTEEPHSTIPQREDAYVHDATAPRFNAFVFSLGTFFPIVNFHQSDKYLPSGSGPLGRLIQIFFWFETAAGWLLATILLGLFAKVRAAAPPPNLPKLRQHEGEK
jgi:hypothetical protein